MSENCRAVRLRHAQLVELCFEKAMSNKLSMTLREDPESDEPSKACKVFDLVFGQLRTGKIKLTAWSEGALVMSLGSVKHSSASTEAHNAPETEELAQYRTEIELDSGNIVIDSNEGQICIVGSIRRL